MTGASRCSIFTGLRFSEPSRRFRAPIRMHGLIFRGKRDKYANYFTNSILPPAYHKQWCLSLAP